MTPENNPKTILTLSARPDVDRQTARSIDRRRPCRPGEYPPYPQRQSQYRDCKGFTRLPTAWSEGHTTPIEP